MRHVGKAVVVTTFDAECLAVAEYFDQAPHERSHHEERGTLYETGTVTGPSGRWQVSLAEVGPGNSNAGIELERARSACSPDVVLLVGVAGGVKDLALGDVVAAEAVYDYETGKDAESGYLPRIKTQSSSHRLLQHARLVARQAGWQPREGATRAGRPPRAVVKPIAAGSKLIPQPRP
jgi:nucleoside phosphorylase